MHLSALKLFQLIGSVGHCDEHVKITFKVLLGVAGIMYKERDV